MKEGDKGGARKNEAGWGGSCLDDGAAAVEALAVDVLTHAPAVVLPVIAACQAAAIHAAASSAAAAAAANTHSVKHSWAMGRLLSARWQWHEAQPWRAFPGRAPF